MVVGGNQQETLDPGFVLLGTRQQRVPVIFVRERNNKVNMNNFELALNILFSLSHNVNRSILINSVVKLSTISGFLNHLHISYVNSHEYITFPSREYRTTIEQHKYCHIFSMQKSENRP
ncbi:unnamed protein product [Schistosoma curassoni]|uniref:Ovule protein n=1 Tax=Schistosoma curassoni TaxID=6186 RepID=A0A183KYL2_9TREM|nr:unnamed protein product [Schistosoma curassoni]